MTNNQFTIDCTQGELDNLVGLMIARQADVQLEKGMVNQMGTITLTVLWFWRYQVRFYYGTNLSIMVISGNPDKVQDYVENQLARMRSNG